MTAPRPTGAAQQRPERHDHPWDGPCTEMRRAAQQASELEQSWDAAHERHVMESGDGDPADLIATWCTTCPEDDEGTSPEWPCPGVLADLGVLTEGDYRLMFDAVWEEQDQRRLAAEPEPHDDPADDLRAGPVEPQPAAQQPSVTRTPLYDAERVDGFTTYGEANEYRKAYPDAFLAGAHYALDRLLSQQDRYGHLTETGRAMLDMHAAYLLMQIKAEGPLS